MIECPTCPMCDQPPALALSARQAFCGTKGCPALCWNMTHTLAENRRNITVHDLRALDDH